MPEVHAEKILPACGPLLVIIANPTAGSFDARRLDQIVTGLKQHAVTTTLWETRRRGQATQLAHQAVVAGATTVLAVGGDGTINEVANALIKTKVQLAILPMGTANVLAREISQQPQDTLPTLLHGAALSIGVGRDIDTGSYFILMAGFGFDASIVHAVDLQRKARLGKLEYVLTGLQQWSRLNRSTLQVDVDGETLHGSTVIVSNGCYYAGRFCLAPAASLVRPQLAVTVFAGNRRGDLLRYAAGICIGRHSRMADIAIRYGCKIDIRSADGQPVPAQFDGDCGGFAPRRLCFDADALNLLAPSSARHV